MMVDERLNEVGGFELDLVGLPTPVLSLLWDSLDIAHGWVIVTLRQPPGSAASLTAVPTTLRSRAIYAGWVRDEIQVNSNGAASLSGPGLLALIGDANGIGPRNVSIVSASLLQLQLDTIGLLNGLTPSALSTTPGGWTIGVRQTPREGLRHSAAINGLIIDERLVINSSGAFWVFGEQGAMGATSTPTVLAAPGATDEPGGLLGLDAVITRTADPSRFATDVLTRRSVPDDAVFYDSNLSSGRPSDWAGGTASLWADDGQTSGSATQAQNRADATLDSLVVEDVLEISVQDRSDLNRILIPGSRLYAYAPDMGVEGSSSDVRLHNDRMISPITTRVYGMEWHPDVGSYDDDGAYCPGAHQVWYVSNDWTAAADITPWVKRTHGPAVLSVGGHRRMGDLARVTLLGTPLVAP